MNTTPLCVAPFSRVFTTSTNYRVCCATNKSILSNETDSFVTWWNGATMQEFRQKMFEPTLPPECQPCLLSEQTHGTSFRTEINKIPIKDTLPNSWNILFGNICNLACWTCNEIASSTILQHKKQLNILPVDFQNPEETFQQRWPDLESSILESYKNHTVITITILGGEPVYNKTVLNFLNKLVDLGLSGRTRLEITTNGTKLNKKILSILDKKVWNYICVFVSVDAIGKKAEWLRYGSDWNEIKKNINHYQQSCNYVEIHTTLSILNITDLLATARYANSIEVKHCIYPLHTPNFMSLTNWDQPIKLVNRHQFEECGLENYFDLIGQTPVQGTKDKLVQYIKQFDSIRKPLKDFDAQLAQVLDL